MNRPFVIIMEIIVFVKHMRIEQKSTTNNSFLTNEEQTNDYTTIRFDLGPVETMVSLIIPI